MRVYELTPQEKFQEGLLHPNLVNKLLHTRLQAPDFKLHCDQFVGAHDGVLVVDPSLLQEASVSLLNVCVPTFA